ncbi:putative transcription regulator (putative) [Lactiplantibacillus plantarum]|nr:putative transcription regulator (putative) [Lactiplantibacillus plantarum]
MRTITPIENSRRHEEFCPLDTTLSILSGKWKSIIICRLMGNSQRFSSLIKGNAGLYQSNVGDAAKGIGCGPDCESTNGCDSFSLWVNGCWAITSANH